MIAPTPPTLQPAPIDHARPCGILEIPPRARAIIVFVNDLDSCDLNPRNRLVARSLLQRGFAIMLPDHPATTADPGQPARQDRERLLDSAARMIELIDWLALNPATSGLRLGLFGARTGAAAAMIAAARRADRIQAVVTRGGRLDLAEEHLSAVRAPTLMLVGSNDPAVIHHTRQAGAKMGSKPMIELIQGASHLFGEPGKLEQVALISSIWFQRTLATPRRG